MDEPGAALAAVVAGGEDSVFNTVVSRLVVNVDMNPELSPSAF